MIETMEAFKAAWGLPSDAEIKEAVRQGWISFPGAKGQLTPLRRNGKLLPNQPPAYTRYWASQPKYYHYSRG